MECVISIEESTRNLLMLASWLPSLGLAAAVFTLVWRRGRGGDASRRLHSTLWAIAAGVLTLFTCWGALLTLAARLTC